MTVNKRIIVNQLLALGVDARAIYLAIVKDLGGDETGFTYKKGDSISEMPILPSWDEFMADGEWRHHICEVRINLPVAVEPLKEIPQFRLSRGAYGYTGNVRIYGVQLTDGLFKVIGVNEARYNALNFDERCKVMDIDRQTIHAVARLDYHSPFEMGTWSLTVCDVHCSVSYKLHDIRQEVSRSLTGLSPETREALAREFFLDALTELPIKRYVPAYLRDAFKDRDLMAYAPNGGDIEELFFLAGRLGINFQSL
jgi:hypothetical protein